MNEARNSYAELILSFPFLHDVMRPYVGAFLSDVTLVDKFYAALFMQIGFRRAEVDNCSRSFTKQASTWVNRKRMGESCHSR